MSVPVINDKGAVLTIDHRQEIAKGKVNGVGFMRKFGKNDTLANGVWEALWDGSTAGDYPFQTVGSGVIITSDSDFDEPADGAGALAGAQAVHIYGLASGTWALQDEIVAMSGTSVGDYIRIHRMTVLGVGVSGSNVGNISCKMNTVEVAKILPTNGQTLMAVFTIPSGVTGYIDNVSTSVFGDSTSTAKIATLEMLMRIQGESRRVIGTAGLKDNFINKDYLYPPAITEMTDLWLMAKAGTTSVIATGGFDIRLENNE